MPLYDYRCRQCNEKFEAAAKIADCDADQPHEGCGGSGKRIISAVHFDGKMGLDPDFATFSDKWAKQHEKRATGKRKHWDSNNTRYGGEYEKR
jgi:putative FmdB family regulatory protein